MRCLSVISLFSLATTALAGTYTPKVTWPGPNPSNVGFGLYLPDTVKPNSPVVVMIHWCSGSSDAAYSSSGFPALADQLGFPVIFPDSPNTDSKCWDVGSNATLKHNGGGDSYGIVSFIKYVINKYQCDASRVYVTGISSGAMMTQVLAGAYPDVVAAGAEFAGVPFGCWANDGVAQWNTACANGEVSKTGAQWAQLVKDAYPGYSGPRPRLQLNHGTEDSAINYNNFKESIKQWTSVLGISETPVQTSLDTPQSGWTKTVYGSGQLEAYSAANTGHGISYQTGNVARFFGLTSTPTTGPTPTPTQTQTPTPTQSQTPNPTPTSSQTPAPTPSSTTPAPGTGVKCWAQCGGIGYAGATTCAQGSCVKLNDWYSQCQGCQ